MWIGLPVLPSMNFATVYKKKNADLWLVQQGIPLWDGHSTGGEAAFQGSGSSEIARIIPACHKAYKDRQPVTESELLSAPAERIFGYRPGSTLQRYVHEMNIWDDDVGGLYGNISLGSNYRSPFVLRVRLDLPLGGIEEKTWVEKTWNTLQTAFAYAEMFKA